MVSHIKRNVSSCRRYDDVYELSLTFIDGKDGYKREKTISRSCADFFDENGVLCKDLLETAVLKMHRGLSNE